MDLQKELARDQALQMKILFIKRHSRSKKVIYKHLELLLLLVVSLFVEAVVLEIAVV